MSGGGNEDNTSNLGGPVVDSDPDGGSNGELRYRSEYCSSVIEPIKRHSNGVTSPLPGISAQSLANGREATHASQTSSAAVESEMASSPQEQIAGHGTGDIVDNGAPATLTSVASRAEQPQATQIETTPALSPRQLVILRHLISGDSNKSIARKVLLSEATVKVHVKTILRKIRVHNRTQAAIWALNHSLNDIGRELTSIEEVKAPVCVTKN